MGKVLEINRNDLQIVVLKCPYTTYYKSKETRELFEKMAVLKYQGYFSRHCMGVQPIDGTDYLTDHLLICKKVNGELVPINAVKSLPRHVCEPNNTDFTIDKFLRDNNREHHAYLSEELIRAHTEGKKVSYYSSWTMSGDIHSRSERERLKEIFGAITVLHHHEQGIEELFGLGVPKMGTDKFFYKWGFERATRGTYELPNINFRVLNGIDGVFIHLKQYSEYAMNLAEKYLKMWEERIVVGESYSEEKHFKKAA